MLASGAIERISRSSLEASAAMRAMISTGSWPGSDRTSTSSRQLSGTMFMLTPPAIGPMPIVAYGTVNASSRSSAATSS